MHDISEIDNVMNEKDLKERVPLLLKELDRFAEGRNAKVVHTPINVEGKELIDYEVLKKRLLRSRALLRAYFTHKLTKAYCGSNEVRCWTELMIAKQPDVKEEELEPIVKALSNLPSHISVNFKDYGKAKREGFGPRRYCLR